MADVALALVGHGLAMRLHVQLGRPARARAELGHALDALCDLNSRLPHELHDPLDAPAPAVPAE